MTLDEVTSKSNKAYLRWCRVMDKTFKYEKQVSGSAYDWGYYQGIIAVMDTLGIKEVPDVG
jgi:hypothetical protein